MGELGFGTGLNFAVIADVILRETHANLHFISCDAYPLAPADWRRVLAERVSRWPWLQDLLNQPLPLLSGWHRRTFCDGRIQLSVYHGEGQHALADLHNNQQIPIDAWLLDGFAPDRNPQLWQTNLFQSLADLSHNGTSVTTFTAAGHVRRGLQAAGFEMRRVDQRPHKRESLAGVLRKPRQTPTAPPTHVNVHGAGIGGAAVARHLAEAQIDVTVFDPASRQPRGSDIRHAVLHARLLGDGSTDADLRVTAYHYGTQFLHRFEAVRKTGALQIQGPNLDAHKLQRIVCAYGGDTPQQDWFVPLTAHSNQNHTHTDALWFPDGGVVDLPALCDELLDHPRIERIKHAQPGASGVNVIACGSQTRRFPNCEWLEITDVAGQLDHYRANPNGIHPVVGNGYYVPGDGYVVVGATYEYREWTADQARAHNVDLNRALLPSPAEWLAAERGVRCIASDRRPVVGELTPNQWIATAFGSMGTTAAPLAAEYVAAAVTGHISVLPQHVCETLRPQRFEERQARRGIRHIRPLDSNPPQP